MMKSNISAILSQSLFRQFGSVAGISLVLLSGIASSTVEGAQLWQRDAKFYAGVALPCVIALILSNIMTTMSGLKKPERVTSCIECCYQNCGIATSVCLSMFKGDELAEAMGVPFFYGCVEFAVIGMYCIGAWKAGWTKAPPTEPFWKVVTASYEVLLDKKLAQENNIEVKLSSSYDIEVAEQDFADEPLDGGMANACLYYCHEPEMNDVDSPAPVEPENPVKKTGKEESFVGMAGNARAAFWRSLGYNVE